MPTTKYEDPRANRCADFFFPDGKIPSWFDDLVAQRARVAAEAFRPDLPPEALRRVHTPWEMKMRPKTNPDEVVRVDLFFDDKTGVALFKLAEDPVDRARPTSQYNDWSGFEFRPFCWTWEEAEQAAKAAGA